MKYCMLNWKACKHGCRIASYDWKCEIHAFKKGVVLNDGDSVYVEAPRSCDMETMGTRELTKEEANI